MDVVSLIIQLISGALGANMAGAAMKEKSLGPVGNSLAGLFGGAIGGTILQTVMGSAAASGGGMDLTSLLANVGGGAVAARSWWLSSGSSRTRWPGVASRA